MPILSEDTPEIGAAEKDENDQLDNSALGTYWISRLDNARNYDQDYRYDAYTAIQHFRSKKVAYRARSPITGTNLKNTIDISTRMNIFYGNVETLMSTILPKIPKVVVQKRSNKDDAHDLIQKQLFTVCCEVIEKTLSYFINKVPHRTFRRFKYDWLITGRGVLWITYQRKKKQEIKIDRVSWADFTMDPKGTWEDVKWVARRFYLNKAEFIKNFPNIDIKLVHFDDYKNRIDIDMEYDHFSWYAMGDRFIEVWEVWDKDHKRAMHISKQCDQKILKHTKIEDDDEYFFPTPEPVLSVENVLDMMPRSEYWSYYHECAELSLISERKTHLINSIQAKGFTSKQNADLVAQLNKATDGYIFSANIPDLDSGKPLVQYIDNDSKQKVVAALNDETKDLINRIYEITGISEIMRNVSVEETATNARLRTKFGSMRLQDKQRLLNEYVKEMYGIASAVICRDFEVETFEAITSMKLPRDKDINKQLQDALHRQEQLKQQLSMLQNPQMQQPQQPMQQGAQSPDQGMDMGSQQQMPPDQEQGYPDEGQAPQEDEVPQAAPQEEAQQEQPPMQVSPDQGEEQPPEQPPMQVSPDQEAPEDQGQYQDTQPPQQPPQPSPEELQAQQQQVQQQIQQLQYAEMQTDEQVQALKNTITWEKVTRYLGEHRIEDYLLEVETDFETLEDDPLMAQERVQQLQMFLQVVLQQALPAMFQDPTVSDLVAAMLSHTLDSFKMSRTMRGMVDEYLYNVVQKVKQVAANPQPQPPNPEQVKAQAAMAEAQAKQTEAQAAMMKAQAEVQEVQAKQMTAQANMIKAQAEAQSAGAPQGDNPQDQQHEMNKIQAQIQAANARAQAKSQSDTNLMQMKIQADDNRYREKTMSDMQKTQMQEHTKMQLEQLRQQKANADMQHRAMLETAKLQQERSNNAQQIELERTRIQHEREKMAYDAMKEPKT